MVTSAIRPRPPFRLHPLPSRDVNTPEFHKRLAWWDIGKPQTDYPIGIVTWVCDGDTLDVSVDGAVQRVRMVGLDAPEMHLPLHGAERGAHDSLFALARLCLGCPVAVIPSRLQPTHDQYGRAVAHIIRQPDGLHIGLEIIRQGWALPWPRYEHELSAQFGAAALFASAMKFGLWGLAGTHPLTALSSAEPDHVA